LNGVAILGEAIDIHRRYSNDRNFCSGCPLAVICEHIEFPNDKDLFINMMPFKLFEIDSLPENCRQYWEIIQCCSAYIVNKEKDSIGYLTIDERVVEENFTHRRRGLHVESPGHLILNSTSQTLSYSGGSFIPGVEHHRGNGIMMRSERIEGGIFMASNVADSTAVWNTKLNDPFGDIVGLHGNIERLRAVLGPPTKLLKAGELIWMVILLSLRIITCYTRFGFYFFCNCLCILLID
jgi:hypothetical protein